MFWHRGNLVELLLRRKLSVPVKQLESHADQVAWAHVLVHMESQGSRLVGDNIRFYSDRRTPRHVRKYQH